MSRLDANIIAKTNFNANAQTLELDVASLNSVRFEFSGTYNFTALFEALGSDNTTWFPFQVTAPSTGAVSSSHATANATQAYEAGCSTVSKVRVRLSAFTSAGLNTHRVAIVGSAAFFTPAPVPTVALGAGSQVIGNVGTAAGTALSVVSAATTNLTSIKTTAGNLFELTASNPTATPAYIKLYNKASAPVVATDVPVLTITVPAASPTGLPITFGFSQIGKRFTTGIALAITGGVAATDSTNAVAGVQVHGTYI